MKRGITIGITFTVLLAVTSCKNDKLDNISNVRWMVGNWESETPEGVLKETWKMVGDSTLDGFAYALAGTDTTFSEKAMISKKNNILVYTVTVNDQTTDFALISNEGEVVFENLQNEYPQRIIYTKPKNDSLFARIEGVVDGVFSKEEFAYKRSE